MASQTVIDMGGMENQSGFWLAAAMAGPFVGSVVSFVWPRRGGVVGLAATATMVFCAVALAVDVERIGAVGHQIGGWGAPLGIDLRADGLSAIMILMTAVVGLGVSVHALRYFDHKEGGDRETEPARSFWPLWLFLLGGLVALFATADLFNAYVTLEIISCAGVALVALGGGARRCGRQFVTCSSDLWGRFCICWDSRFSTPCMARRIWAP